jgi:uncharacterized membrane protein HdeD (DUF308 family)
MGLSILVARILALTYISAGIAALSGKITFGKIVESFEKSSGLTFISGFITLIFGMVLVTYHNIWAKSWITLITVIGWMSLLKGIMLIVYPQYISYFKGMYKNERVWGLAMLVLGLLFGCFSIL